MIKDLSELVEVSARIGADRFLIQGAGGNTSFKDAESDTMWIKASGKWLANTHLENTFVQVHLSRVKNMLRQQQSFDVEKMLKEDSDLRPSIETTMHAALSHPFVIHVHGVNSLAWLVQKEPKAALIERMAGLNWLFVPYAKPGISLACQIHGNPDVVLLQNHGVVVGAESAGAAESLITDIEERLKLEIRPLNADLVSKDAPVNYQLANDRVQGLAFDEIRLEQAASGSLYPDHVVFLGPGLPVYEELADADEAESTTAVIRNKGVFVHRQAPKGTDEMLGCLVDVLERLPIDAPLNYLQPQDEQELLNWDAEQYRQYLAKQNS